MAATNKNVLIDSNVIIYSAQPEFEKLSFWLKKKNIAVSTISRIEVLGFANLLETEKISLITTNLEDFENVEELILIDPSLFDT
ncbi:MAG TPA: hypothetical protein VKX40_02605 [Aequorivita sp.]|nr:hypothetical protein [Aequorivita sp.]